MKNKPISVIIVTIICLFCYNLCCFADSVSLYGNLDDSNNTCNMLVDVMRNDQNYDPHNQYVCMRTGEREYKIYFGKNITSGDLFCYTYTTAYQSVPARITRTTTTSLSINDNGYYYVGNVPGSLASAQAENYKTGAIISVVVIIIVLLILFKIFRKSRGVSAKAYTIRG